MNKSQTKIRKIQEANKVIENRFLLSEKHNPIISEDVSGVKTPTSKKLPTDYNKNITFLFPDKTSLTIKPQKQEISKSIIDLLEIGDLPTNNFINLTKLGAVQKTCGSNYLNRKIYIFTKPNSAIENWCKLSNINPENLRSEGIFEIPYKPEFVSVGTWKSGEPQSTKI